MKAYQVISLILVTFSVSLANAAEYLECVAQIYVEEDGGQKAAFRFQSIKGGETARHRLNGDFILEAGFDGVSASGKSMSPTVTLFELVGLGFTLGKQPRLALAASASPKGDLKVRYESEAKEVTVDINCTNSRPNTEVLVHGPIQNI